jgi:hypothetical protein
MILHVNSYSSKICMFVGVSQYTSLFTIYESLLIRISGYTNLRSTHNNTQHEGFICDTHHK